MCVGQLCCFSMHGRLISPTAPATARRRALSQPPSVGYSQQCLLARGSVLKRAVETLLDPQVGDGRFGCSRARRWLLRGHCPQIAYCRLRLHIAAALYCCWICVVDPALPCAYLAVALQGRKAYDEALLRGEITEEVPDEFVPGGCCSAVHRVCRLQTPVAGVRRSLVSGCKLGRCRLVYLSQLATDVHVASTAAHTCNHRCLANHGCWFPNSPQACWRCWLRRGRRRLWWRQASISREQLPPCAAQLARCCTLELARAGGRLHRQAGFVLRILRGHWKPEPMRQALMLPRFY